MRQAEQDGEHMWLRQSVTFTANGQTRTVEMAIPLRPGAPDDEIERLLADAEAGMWRISQRLDSHVAALLNGGSALAGRPHTAPAASLSLGTDPSAPVPAPAAPIAPIEASRPSTPAPAPAPAATPQPAARPERPEPPERSTPAAAASRSPAPVPTNAPSRSAPAAPPASPARSRPSGPLTAPVSTPANAPAPAVPAGAELSRKDFIAATADLGLSVKQVMERLHVRSLEGLDLREALEALRRQMLRDGESLPAPIAPAAPVAPSASPPSPLREAAPAPAAPHYFEEEDDDFDVTFTMDGEDALAEEFGPDEAPDVPSGTGPSGAGDLDDLDALSDFDLDDVPDFGPPPSAAHAHRPASATPASARRSGPAKAAAAPPTPPAPPSAPVEEQAPAASPEVQRITQLRAVRGGGAPTTYQRSAYRNVVVNELGEEAAALVRGLWRVNPERLGPEQLDALISWGKQDTFAEEATSVLTALRAERQQAAAAAATPAPEDTPAGAPRPAARPRAPQPPRAPSGGR